MPKTKMIPLDALYERDKGICGLCHKKVKREQATRDHITPRSMGGANRASNLMLAHKHCNTVKGDGLTNQERYEFDVLLQDGLCFICLSILPSSLSEVSKASFNCQPYYVHKTCKLDRVARMAVYCTRDCIICGKRAGGDEKHNALHGHYPLSGD